MKLTIDNKQRLMTGFLVFIELYKMLMGSFLVIFVPQKCNGLTCTASQTLFRGGLLNMTGTSRSLRFAGRPTTISRRR